jgi:HPt (histidine-containing phosphotransfer) domain-containing protein
MVGDREKVLAAGMNDHIAKPVQFDDMFATLARWVRPAAARPPRSAGAGEGGAGAGPLAGLPGVDTRAGLAAMRGDELLYRRLLGMFRDGERDFEARFKAARAAGDTGTALRMAHDLKSTAAALGIHSVREAATILEQACADGAADVDALVQGVVRSLDPVIQGLQALGPAQPPKPSRS